MSETTGKPWVWLTGRAACGCRFKLASDGGGAALSYCPLHAAAGELLAACKIAASPVEHVNGCLWKSDKQMPCQCGYNDRINRGMQAIEDAIKRAEGRS